MGSTNKTANLGLSQFIGTDKPTWLVDYNNDMAVIDEAIGELQNDSGLTDTAIAELQTNVQNLQNGQGDSATEIAEVKSDVQTLSANYETMHHELVLNQEQITETGEEVANVNNAVEDNTKRINKLTANSPVVYIDPISGNDSNDGLTENTAIKTVTQFYKIAMQYRNVRLAIKAGTTLNVTNNLATNILIVNSYGTGDKPILKCVNDNTYLAFNDGCTFNNINIDTNGKYLQISARRFETIDTVITSTGRIDFKGMIKIYTNTTVADDSTIELSEGILAGLNYLPNPSNFKLSVRGGIAILPTFEIGTVTVNGGVAIKTGTYTV